MVDFSEFEYQAPKRLKIEKSDNVDLSLFSGSNILLFHGIANKFDWILVDCCGKILYSFTKYTKDMFQRIISDCQCLTVSLSGLFQSFALERKISYHFGFFLDRKITFADLQKHINKYPENDAEIILFYYMDGVLKNWWD